MAYDNSKGLVEVRNASTQNYVMIPLKYISFENYKFTRNMMDLDSYRSETGVLIRNPLKHRASKIEFSTPIIKSADLQALLNIIDDGYTDSTARELYLRYYNPETDGYSTGRFYRPDIEFDFRHIDGNKIQYSQVRIAFIEY